MFLLKNYNHEKKKVKILNNFWSPHQTRERKRSKFKFSHFFAKISDFFQGLWSCKNFLSENFYRKL